MCITLSEPIALFGAFLFGLGIIFARKGLGGSNFLSVTVIITLIGTIVFWILFLVTVPLNEVNPMGVAFFALAGLFDPGFARLIYFKGMETLGASTNESIFATYPLFGSLIAVFMLGEDPSLGIWVGMTCIICGILLIERNAQGTPIKSATKRIGLALPLSSAILVGFGFILRKMGLNAYSEPIAGVAITYLSSLCLYTLLSTTMRRSILLNKQSLQLFCTPGLIYSVAHLCFLYALRYGDVSIVAPLMNMEPFFVVILASVFLRELEKITYKLVIGTLIIVTGVSLITIF